MGDPLVDLEWGALITPCSGHHSEVILVVPEYHLHPRADPISYKNLHSLLRV